MEGSNEAGPPQGKKKSPGKALAEDQWVKGVIAGFEHGTKQRVLLQDGRDLVRWLCVCVCVFLYACISLRVIMFCWYLVRWLCVCVCVCVCVYVSLCLCYYVLLQFVCVCLYPPLPTHFYARCTRMCCDLIG